MTNAATAGPGRPAAATRDEVLALATERFLAAERVDMQAIARELGLARATMHRWFGTRELLLGETLAKLAEARLLYWRALIVSTASSLLRGDLARCSPKSASERCASWPRAREWSSRAWSRSSSA